MNTNQLKRFAKDARIKLIDQVGRKLDFVLTHDTAELRGKANEITQLKQKIAQTGKEQVIEMVAYTWFNRLMALRFMDANGYTVPKVITPCEGMTNPELLQNALGGNIESDLNLDRQRINDLLDGRTASTDAHTESYKLLLIAVCNHLNTAMPFMFERISDYSELLLPDDLLSDYSIVADIRNGMSDEDCQQEEIIGWIYQFYIADKKDEVFNGLKKNIKITAENIPAATQLFTPRWIVRYMVENTLGKLWLNFKPNSRLREFMPYYIESPEENGPAPLPEGIKSVLDITFLDPCQGSGHVLVYAFDLFTRIYEEEGYNINEIPALILKHNLFGIDIDARAAQLAAFALTMKARGYYSRFLRKPVQPNVISLENVSEEIIQQSVQLPLTIKGKRIEKYADLSLSLLIHADNFGSLIQIESEEMKAIQIKEGGIWQEEQLKLKLQGEYLSRQYYCVVTNPPYMGGQGMNELLKNFIEKYYNNGKADLMTCFMQRCGDLIYSNCSYGMINLPSWLFLSSFEGMRKSLLKNYHINSMLHMGRGIFGIDFGSVAFIILKSVSNSNGTFYRLHQRNFQHIYFQHIEQLFLRAKQNPLFRFDFNNYRDEDGVSEIPHESNENGLKLVYYANQKNLLKIPGSPLGYWLSKNFINKISESENIGKKFDVVAGISTGANSEFIFFWHEVNFNSIWNGELDQNKCKAFKKHNKGGDTRKWYGNQNYVIKYNPLSLNLLKQNAGFRHDGERYYYKESISWSKITSSINTFRYYPKGFCFDSAGLSIFSNDYDSISLLGFLNSKVSQEILKMYNPTLNASPGVIKKLPYIPGNTKLTTITDSAILTSKLEWNSKETSCDFEQNELLKNQNKSLKASYEIFNKYWTDKFYELHSYEEELNRQYIEIYDLQDELSPNVPLDKITILQEEAKIVNNELLIDVVPVLLQLISYSVGCIFGRYTLEKQGLILVNQGETLQDFLKYIPFPSFMPDEDNIIPVLEGEWFTDDIVGRLKVFIKVAFGEEYFEKNIKFIEASIGKEIRRYFVKDFYNDHIKRYKKRPIYWMFSSPKGHFKALIYMHRYQADLCSKLLNDYLLAFISKLEAAQQTQKMFSIREDISVREKTLAIKKMDKYEAMLKDCKEYEKTLFVIATQKIVIDLDDGVKVNYQKFKDVLVPIKGLEKEEE
jgi:hypothetical protein